MRYRTTVSLIGHLFLQLLGSGPLEAAMTADQAIDFIGR